MFKFILFFIVRIYVTMLPTQRKHQRIFVIFYQKRNIDSAEEEKLCKHKKFVNETNIVICGTRENFHNLLCNLFYWRVDSFILTLLILSQ